MLTHIPKILCENEITDVLDDIKLQYGKLTRRGIIYGQIVIDQDAKIIAKFTILLTILQLLFDLKNKVLI